MFDTLKKTYLDKSNNKDPIKRTFLISKNSIKDVLDSDLWINSRKRLESETVSKIKSSFDSKFFDLKEDFDDYLVKFIKMNNPNNP